MKMIRWVLLAFCLLLAGCGAEPAPETVPETTAPVETAAPTEMPTEPPTEPVEVLPVAELPDEDSATGTLCFYFGDKTVYAGGQVADILDIGIQTDADLEQLIQPGQMSEVVRVRIEDQAVAEEDRPFLFFVAFNPTEEPRKLAECGIYSLTVNTDKGIAFGSGQEEEHFYTGETTLDEMIAAYGEPDYQESRKRQYREIAYYEPFNCAYFSFKNGKVRQIFTYYNANYYGEQAEAFDHELTGYFGNDCYILMDQYLDMGPYLTEREETASLKSFAESVRLGDQTIELGKTVEEMPSPFRDAMVDLTVPLSSNAYITMGRDNPEEFWVINKGRKSSLSDGLVVKGVITKNRGYTNWGTDNSLFHTFEYDGLTQDATIEDILEKYGAPDGLDCTSNARKCFAWMEYEDENGNYVHFCVDPMTDQIVEIHINKYFEKERHA